MATQPPPYQPTDPQKGAYPPQPGYPPQQPGYPPQQPGHPPQQPGYPPQQGQGYAPQQGYQGQSYPPPQPAHHSQQTTMVIQQQPTIIVPVGYGEAPVSMTCPFCHATIVTSAEYVPGTLAWLICVVLFFVFWPCCFLPFCIDGCKDVVHSCPNCHRQVGTFSRM